MGIKNFFKQAFSDMKADAKAQHEVDKANFEAAKAEARANHTEAKAMGKRDSRQKLMQEKRNAQIEEAKARSTEAQKRIDRLN